MFVSIWLGSFREDVNVSPEPIMQFDMQCSKLKALLNVLKFNTELKMVIKERESYGVSRHFQQYVSYKV
jgi:hypothetical protein